MSYLYLLIGIIFGGIVDRYAMPICDLILQQFTNNKHLQTKKKQREINQVENDIALESLDTEYEGALIQKDIFDIKVEMQKQDTNLIGFRTDEEMEYPEDWDDEDCDCGCIKSKIGFGYKN